MKACGLWEGGNVCNLFKIYVLRPVTQYVFFKRLHKKPRIDKFIVWDGKSFFFEILEIFKNLKLIKFTDRIKHLFKIFPSVFSIILKIVRILTLKVITLLFLNPSSSFSCAKFQLVLNFFLHINGYLNTAIYLSC